MAYWLLKTEAAAYGWDDLVRDGGTEWDGVRNAQAAANLRLMAPGDRALLYHSVDQKRAVGVVRIVCGAQPEAGAPAPWVSVRVEPDAPFDRPVTLAAMKADPRLGALAMIRQSRLSVSPVTDDEWAAILALGRGTAPDFA